MALMVMDWDFHLRGELAQWTSLQLTRSYWGLGSFELRLPEGAPGAEALALGRVVFFSQALHKAMVVEKLTRQRGQVAASGKPLKGVAARRICVPPAQDDGHFGWDRFTGSAEAAYHHYAAANLYAPQDPHRAVQRLVPGDNLGRGPVLPWQARFTDLAALLAAIGEATEIGWDILPDFHGQAYVFGARAGRDLTGGPGAVILSEGNRNAADLAFTWDASAYRSTAYVGGAGEDENRLIYAQGQEHAGVERRETWVDAGSVADTEMLRAAARQKLDGAQQKELLTAEMLEGGLTRYERDYDLGDNILLRGAGWQTATRLLEVRESYEGGGRKLSATFGATPITAAGAIAQIQNATVR